MTKITDREATVRVHLNGKERDIPDDLTVGGVLHFLELDPRLVVVEHNREILDRARFDAVKVGEGDRLELVHFVGGG
ncbi:MAG: sulfur carrier protein ThiS [Gemmatimonadota bacterium]